MPPNRFESEVESFLEGSHGDRTHIKRADHHAVTPLYGTLLVAVSANRATWPTEPGRGARGCQGLAELQMAGRRYKRRQTNAIQIASRGPL